MMDFHAFYILVSALHLCGLAQQPCDPRKDLNCGFLNPSPPKCRGPFGTVTCLEAGITSDLPCQSTICPQGDECCLGPCGEECQRLWPTCRDNKTLPSGCSGIDPIADGCDNIVCLEGYDCCVGPCGEGQCQRVHPNCPRWISQKVLEQIKFEYCPTTPGCSSEEPLCPSGLTCCNGPCGIPQCVAPSILETPLCPGDSSTLRCPDIEYSTCEDTCGVGSPCCMTSCGIPRCNETASSGSSMAPPTTS